MISFKSIRLHLKKIREIIVVCITSDYLERMDKLQLLVNPDNMKEFVYKDNQYNRGLVADMLCCIVFFMKHPETFFYFPSDPLIFKILL